MAQHFISGQWVAGSNGQTLPVIDPSTGEVFDTLARGTAADIDKAVAAARRPERTVEPPDRDRPGPYSYEDVADHAGAS